ncbi:MAG TPA: AAA domain-containing protein [Verrucomicrobiae bacterium]|nr:AAA domain-containing protein [Verrucomicrobiae bacterium]
MPTFAEYLEKWLKQSTAQGLTNPLVKMPVKRFRLLQPNEFGTLANGGTLIIGTMADPISRNLHKNYQTRIRERGEHCAFICSGSVEMIVAGAVDGKQRKQLFPVCLKRASFQTSGDKIKAAVADDEPWQFNPVLQAHLRALAIKSIPASVADNPVEATKWVKAQLGNRASQVTSDSYVGLFSSQQMVVQNRLTDPPLRQALAKNPVVQAKIAGGKIEAVDNGEITDDGLEELGLTLPCDDSQLRVIQLSHNGHCMQVEGPPGTGKSQTIANIISNALYHGRNVLLVCDKKAAIVQVEERLSNAGLKPAMLNLHDEDLDKREFLRQATDKFPAWHNARIYPFTQLKESRQTLNERVRFARGIAHPSLQVTKREALAGLIQLRKELKNVPNLSIANWQALSKERLTKLLGCLGEWPELVAVLTDNKNIWNNVRVEAFDDNPNAANELQETIQRILGQLELLQGVREWAAAVGMELLLNSDANVKDMLALVTTVLEKPVCHTRLIGNSNLSQSELAHLKSQWERREKIVAARHPVVLSKKYSEESEKAALAVAERAAKDLLRAEGAKTWDDLSRREAYHKDRRTEIDSSQKAYRRLCEQIGLVYSPLLTVRRAQLQTVISLASLATAIPRAWWKSDTAPVLTVAGWKAHFQACATHAKNSPLPLHFIALERVATTHWEHVEAKAEHGFNLVSYCVHFVNDRKCKYALRQVFPAIPPRGFKQWQEVTLHAVTALRTVVSLRAAAETHVVLKQMTSAYLAVAHEGADHADNFLSKEEVQALEKMAALVEQMRDRNDLFQVTSVHWQTFWESTNASLLASVKAGLSGFDLLALPDEQQSDDLEDALAFYEAAHQSIRKFLQDYEQQEGDRTNSVMAGFAAQREFADCLQKLVPLTKYMELQPMRESPPDWTWLHEVIAWRDLFERLRGQQKLDIDSGLWTKLRDRLQNHQAVMAQAYEELDALFEHPRAGIQDHTSLVARVGEMLSELQRRPLWLEKRRWRGKISAFPEIKSLWSKILDGSVKPSQGQKLFCFNLLRLCDPVAKPHGLEFKQTLKEFREQDENLASWVIDHLKANLREKMDEAAQEAAQSESELRHLAGLQRIRGTVRELVNAHVDYLIAAKPCWLMSPTSLANLIDSQMFEEHGVPFDLVVFDEASQIRVLDGLLSMSFGKQVIIVGDKNQLPPTDFFAGFAAPEAEAEDFGISESLLEEFGGVFEEDKTQVMLMSHYRSETPDLIAFSNNWFYGGKLEMYPPAHISGIGRRLHYLPKAVYSESGERNNPAEAQEVVKLIELHVREHPNKSLGVVTMNIPQMELIDEQLIFAPDAVRAYCADESKFFLRNLETVQGDEMDRILLSLTYGKNANGQFNASVLGPLNKSGGERRLNVAITRSRSGLIVVSSLKVADLEATGAQSRGFQCLKAFLANLENTDVASTFGISSKRFERRNDGVSNIVYCESPFEEQVVEFLENEGYDIECQYGAGNFRLDIIIKERGKNILAIECDGAAYHSSLVARTRDRARQRVLEKLGWRVHRVWSTNWWRFEQQEKEGIVEAINAARAG